MNSIIVTSNTLAPLPHAACYHVEARKYAIYMDDLDPNTGDGEEYHRWEANGCICSSDFSDDEDDDWMYAPDLNVIEFNQSLHQAHVIAWWDHIPF